MALLGWTVPARPVVMVPAVPTEVRVAVSPLRRAKAMRTGSASTAWRKVAQRGLATAATQGRGAHLAATGRDLPAILLVMLPAATRSARVG